MSFTKFSGKIFSALSITPNHAVGASTLNQLELFGLKSPYHMARSTLSRLDASDHDNKELRTIIQRTWDTARSNRASSYREYLERLYRGTIIGGVPPITLYIPQQGVTPPGTDSPELHFGYKSGIITIDGETQAEARFRLRDGIRNADDEDIFDVPALLDTGDWPFSIVIHHGVSEDHAIQILHDTNRYAKPIPESKLGSRNTTGGLSQTIADALLEAGLEKSNLNPRGPTGTKKHLAGFGQLMHFVTGFAYREEAMQSRASRWFDTLNQPGTDKINSDCFRKLAKLLKLADHDKAIGTAPTALWQLAGILCADGFDPADMRWENALIALKTAPKAKGTFDVQMAVLEEAMRPATHRSGRR